MINLKVLRVHIKGWTASFRYPIFVIGFQPTLSVPPLSTIYGIVSAARGEYVTPNDVKLGYIFKSSGKFIDLETVYELDEKNTAKSNVCKREILFEPDLYIYINDLNYKEYFRNPMYPILLGRSQDPGMINEIKEIELEKTDINGSFGGTTVPFPKKHMYGMIQALPSYFTNTIPRYAAGTKPYHVVSEFKKIPLKDLYYDRELGLGVYMHE